MWNDEERRADEDFLDHVGNADLEATSNPEKTKSRASNNDYINNYHRQGHMTRTNGKSGSY